MPKTYMEFVYTALLNSDAGKPIYTHRIAQEMAGAYNLQFKEATAATAVAIKRILDGNIMSELRFYQKGIYYRTEKTPFGELGIRKGQLIADKYLLPDIGYETGLHVLHLIGLTSQMPMKQRILATNKAKKCQRLDKKLGVIICPPKLKVTTENKESLRVLDVLDLLGCAPVDAEHPYTLINDYIQEHGLKYETLLAIADQYYNKNTVLQLAHAAGMGGVL